MKAFELKTIEEAWEECRKRLEIPEELSDTVKTVFYGGAQAALTQILKDVKNGETGEAAFKRALKDVDQALAKAIAGLAL